MTIGNRPLVRADGRSPTQLRPIRMTLGVQKWAEGSCRIEMGDTIVLCAATISDRVPPHLRGKGTGWVTAEYSMLPRSTAERTDRESVKGRIGGRTHEIQRLIGRSLRGVVDLARLGERTITVDCDVLQADGGTRTASITGGYVALGAALITYGMERLLVSKVSAVSVGIVESVPYLDLDYSEDSRAEVDFNVVGTDASTYVELQGTAEGRPFDRDAANGLLDLADDGLRQLFEAQAATLATVQPVTDRRRLLVATRSPHKLRELRELLALDRGGAGLPRRPRDRRRAGRGRRHVRDERPPQGPLLRRGRAGCRPWPTIRDSRSTRSAVAPASAPAGTRARTRPTPTTMPGSSASWRAVGPERARSALRVRARPRPARRAGQVRRGTSPRQDRRQRRRARAASATTRSSSLPRSRPAGARSASGRPTRRTGSPTVPGRRAGWLRCSAPRGSSSPNRRPHPLGLGAGLALGGGQAGVTPGGGKTYFAMSRMRFRFGIWTEP